MPHNARKHGIPVLAYSSLNDPAPMLSSLFFRANSSRQITLSLKSTFHISGLDDMLTLILQINPDDLVPGQNRLNPANIALPQERLNKIQRQGNPNIRTLCLSLGQRCSVWYSKSIPTPARGAHPALDELASLATASKLYILLDTNWIGNEKRDVFDEIINHPDRFTAYPVEEHYSKENECLDWTLFDAPAYRDSTTDDEEPYEGPTPLYSEAIGQQARRTLTPSPPPSSLKRLSASTPSPPSSTLKRVLTEADAVAIHTNTIEKDSAGTPHLNPEHSSGASTAALSSGPNSGTSRRDLFRVVDEELDRSLTDRIGKIIPSLVERLVTHPPPSPSQRSVASEMSTTPPPPDLTPLGKTLGDYLMKQIDAKFEEFCEQNSSHADFQRSLADDKFQADLEAERNAFTREAESTFNDLEEKCTNLAEDAAERFEWKLEAFLDLFEDNSGNADFEERADQTIKRPELRKKMAGFKRRIAELSRGEEELRNERVAFSAEKLDFLREMREEKAEMRKEKAEMRAGKAEMKDEKAEMKEEKAEMRAEKAEMREEKAERKKEKQLRAQTSREALDKERDL